MELFANITNKLVKNSLMKSLRAIVADTQDASKGFATILKTQADKLVAADPSLIEVNLATLEGVGDKATIGVRATAAAIAAVESAPAPVAVERPVIDKDAFVIEEGIPVPEIRRGGDRTNAYPFDKLPVGGSFFVPATDAMPNPAKTLGSTVSSATRRYKNANPKRVFTVRGGELGPNGAKGARIWRTE